MIAEGVVPVGSSTAASGSAPGPTSWRNVSRLVAIGGECRGRRRAPPRPRPRERGADHLGRRRGRVESAAELLPDARWHRCAPRRPAPAGKAASASMRSAISALDPRRRAGRWRAARPPSGSRATRSRRTGPPSGYDPSAVAAGSRSMRRRLVVPATPKGMPAAMTIRETPSAGSVTIG